MAHLGGLSMDEKSKRWVVIPKDGDSYRVERLEDAVFALKGYTARYFNGSYIVECGVLDIVGVVVPASLVD